MIPLGNLWKICKKKKKKIIIIITHNKKTEQWFIGQAVEFFLFSTNKIKGIFHPFSISYCHGNSLATHWYQYTKAA